MGVDRSSLSSPGVARSAARTTGDGLAVVRQQPTSPGNHCDQIDDFGSCNLDSIHQGGPIFEGPTCSPSRQERMILSRIFSSGEPGPQLTWTAMMKPIPSRPPREYRHASPGFPASWLAPIDLLMDVLWRDLCQKVLWSGLLLDGFRHDGAISGAEY